MALLRGRLPLRSALAAQHSLSLLAARHFSTNEDLGECLGGSTSALDPTIPAAAAADAPAALADTAASLAGAAASMDVTGPVSLAIQAVDALHAATGAPWWATISAVGVMVRLAMLPVTLQSMKAMAAGLPLLERARQQAAEDEGLVAETPAGAVAAARGGGKEEQQQGQQQQQAQQQPVQRQPSLGRILARFHELRQEAGVPHPAWVVGSPLIQLPVFVTAMWSIRRMSLSDWPGFSTGGLAWFTDLTLPAMDLANFTAPMGNMGIVLPLVVALSMYGNIDAGFSVPDEARRRQGQSQSGAVQLWVMSQLRLLLEWAVVPMFAISLQLPQGALCYWATTSSFSLLQAHALKDPTVRRLVGLPVGRTAPLPPPSTLAKPLEGDLGDLAAAEAAAAAAAGSGAAAGSQQGWTAHDEAVLRHFLTTTRDQMKLFERAAELRVEGKVGAAITVLRRLLQLHPRQPRALFALGQLHALLRDWRASEMHYMDAANNEQDKQQKARAWFGVGVALHMQREHETAIQAFQKAAKFAQEEELRLRSWVSEATLQKKLGNTEQAVELLRKAAKLDAKVEELYLKPLLAELQEKEKGRQEASPPS